MKRITYWLPLSIFITSQIFRIMHWPGSAILLILVPMIQLTFAIIDVIKLRKIKNASIKLVPFALGFIYLYLLYDLLMWPGLDAMLGLAAVFSIVVLIIAVARVKSIKSPELLMLALLGLSVFLFFVPGHKQFKFFSSLESEEYLNTQSFYWFEYSRLLYEDQEYEEAVKAIDKAISIDCGDVEPGMDSYNCEGLKRTRIMIIDNEWTDLEYIEVLNSRMIR